MLTYLIDDDHISLYLTEQVLRIEGFSTEIHAFTGVQDALASFVPRIADGDLPQIVLLDLNMPVLNGWQFLDALRPYESTLLNRCHIYLLTSSLAQADTVKAREYPLVTGIVHKPIDEDDLRTIEDQVKTGNELAAAPG